MNDRSWFDIIPMPAKVMAALAFAASMALTYWFISSFNMAGLGAPIGLAGGSILAGFILLSGYVYA